MVKNLPQIILRADVIKPERVPASITSVFDRFGNYILPKLGVQMAMEFFETGWLTFFVSISDFRSYFSRPLFGKSQRGESPSGTDGKAGEGSFIWDYTFVRIPSHSPEAMLAKILQKFYARPGNLGGGTFQEISTLGLDTRYRILRPDLGVFLRSAEEIVKNAHKLLTYPQKNPDLGAKPQ